METTNNQIYFSDTYSNSMYDLEARKYKANKILAILNNYYKNNIQHLSVLDIGCSNGMISNLLSQHFSNIIGIDTDAKAINFANNKYSSSQLHFEVQDGTKLTFSDNMFDLIICTHIYEHVSDYNKLLDEIYRVLKPGGICFFAAGNRLKFIEGHYKLPMLSVIPKPLAHLYLRLLKKGNYYEENHLTLWSLKKLVSKFKIIDYTIKIIENPNKYYAADMIKENSLKHKISLIILKIAYWLCPTYIWLLHKN